MYVDAYVVTDIRSDKLPRDELAAQHTQKKIKFFLIPSILAKKNSS